MSLFFSLFGFSLCKGEKNAFLVLTRKSQICSRQQPYRTKEETRDNTLLSEAEHEVVLVLQITIAYDTAVGDVGMELVTKSFLLLVVLD